MAGIDQVLERLVVDPAFRDQLRHDPASALSGYVLFDEDLEVLAATLDDAEGGEHGVEQRTSKSTLFAALTEAGDMFAGSAGEQPDVATPDEDATSAPRSQSRNNLKQLGVALHEEDAIDDLTTAPGIEAAAQITYPGVYVQEIPSPESDAADASEIGMPPAVEDEPARGPAGLRSDGELVQASDARAVPEVDASAEGVEGEAHDAHLVAPQEPEPATDAYLEVEGVEEGDPEPPAPPPEMAASGAGPDDGQTEEAETVHAYVSAKGADIEGDSSQPPDPDDAFEDGEGEAIDFLTYEFEKGAPGSPVVASWDQMLVTAYMPEDTPSPGAPGDLAEGDADPVGAGGSGEGAQGPSEVRDLPGEAADSPSTREGFEGQIELTSFSMGGHNPSAEVEGNEVAVEPVVIQNEGFDPESGELTMEIVGGIDVSSDAVDGDGDPDAPEGHGEPPHD